MNDAYYELLVARKHRSTDTLIKAVTIAAIVFLVLASPIFGILSLLLAVVLGFLAYFLIFPRLSIEYEYSLLNHDMEIDIIYNKNKRKKLINLDLKDAEIIAPYGSHRLDYYRSLKPQDYSAQDEDQKPYAIIIPNNQQTACILIQPDDVMIERMANSLPRTFFKD